MMEILNNVLADQFRFLLPEIILVAAACVIFLGGTWRADRNLSGLVCLAGFLGALAALSMTSDWHAPSGAVAVFAAPLQWDGLTTLTRIIALGGGVVLLLFAWKEVPDRQAADHHACLLIIVAGVGLVAAANDLITLFLALELISIPTYVLLYLPKHDDAAQEAALKYFLLSVFSSGLLLFGFSYLYGMTGSSNLSAILHTLNKEASARDIPVLGQVAMIMIMAGLGFRITAVPFHFYAPDVYQGTSNGAAALLAFVPKVAGFVALLRVFGFVLPDGVTPRGGLAGIGLSDQLPILLWFLAALTMFLGNLLALLQDNVKRLLAYSSVAHAGYMLVALASAPFLYGDTSGPNAASALLYYLVAYGAMTVGAFCVLSYLSTPARPVESVDDLAGLGQSQPRVAVLLAIFLFSLIGIPLTAGFNGKFLVIFGAMAVPGEHTHLYVLLAALAMINAAIGGWYYLRLVAVMYLRTSHKPLQPERNTPALVTLCLCALLTVGLSLPPAANWLLQATRNAVAPKSLPPTRVVQSER